MGVLEWSLMIMYIVIGLVLICVFSQGSGSRYPDGTCYMCRRGKAGPGETCPKCGTEQL